jgi:catechol 2,3-dioxygenase-like lactoylglutathione lyase family enzyme
MAKAIHTMIRVLDEPRSLAFYKKAFGLDVADRLEFPDFTLVYLSNSESPYEVELTINKGHGGEIRSERRQRRRHSGIGRGRRHAQQRTGAKGRQGRRAGGW